MCQWKKEKKRRDRFRPKWPVVVVGGVGGGFWGRAERFKNVVANKGLEVVDDGDVGVRGVWPRVRFSGA